MLQQDRVRFHRQAIGKVGYRVDPQYRALFRWRGARHSHPVSAIENVHHRFIQNVSPHTRQCREYGPCTILECGDCIHGIAGPVLARRAGRNDVGLAVRRRLGLDRNCFRLHAQLNHLVQLAERLVYGDMFLGLIGYQVWQTKTCRLVHGELL